MKTDSLFYYLFQTAPGIFFELLGQSPNQAAGYEFRSIELKQTAFRIDGVLLPRSSSEENPVFFVEIQFQLDPYFYQRFLAEIFLFLRQNPQTLHWQAVVLFANRDLEPQETQPFQPLLESQQVNRIYLEDLRQVATDSLGIGLVQLVVADAKQAITQAKGLLRQAQTETSPPLPTAAIIELIETIVVYKFPQLSRKEIEQMLGLSELKQTRVYQEAREEGRQQGESLLILRQLTRRFGPIPAELEAQIQCLSVPQLEALGEALLDFSTVSDLTAWLR